jgi:UDP-N-acetylmuramate dehydrogenase
VIMDTEAAASGRSPLANLAGELRRRSGLDDVTELGLVGPHTTWRVGGAADVLCTATSVEGLATAVQLSNAYGVTWRVLGRGSNVLVGDFGVEGLVILNRASHLSFDGTRLRADSGLLLSTLANRAARAGLAGMEWSAGIPGSVGGAVVSNAGAHGSCVADALGEAELLAPGAGPRWAPVEELLLAYRHSRLRDSGASAEVVLRAVFMLRPDDPDAIRLRMNEYRRQRQATQPLSSASAGSVFKNPPGESAARLIDQAGLKGMCIGGATVSQRHANFVVTQPGASASDVCTLIELSRARVRERFGVELILEVQPIGRKAPGA